MAMSAHLNFQHEKISRLDLTTYATARVGTSVTETLALMRQRRVSAVLVEDETHRVLGIFTERDVLLKVAGEKTALDGRVDSVMTPQPQTLSPDDTVGHALQLMNHGHYRNVPVLDKDRAIVGNLSQHAIITFLTDHYPREIYNLPPESDVIPQTREGA
jgi:CBS domain-containing protein